LLATFESSFMTVSFSRSWAVCLCVVFACAAATAQMKVPKSAQPAAVPRPAAAKPEADEAQPVRKEVSEKEAAGKMAAAGWLTLLDRRDWGTAWETSAGMFRAAVPLPAWMDGIPKVREPLGPLVERAPANSVYKTTLEGRPDGEYVSVIFLSKFNKQEVQEVVTTVREPDGRWRVTGYSTR
jgi:hypothetical protein